MPKWTPGPWVAEGRPPNMTIIFAGETPGKRPSPAMLLDGDQEANARLIAAAPDLYDALSGSRLTVLLAMVEDSADAEMRERARWFMETRDAALAKARGDA